MPSTSKSKVTKKKTDGGAQARADVALVVKRRERGDFLAVSEALVRLRAPAAVRALGRESFADVCESDLDLLREKAEQLIGLARTVASQGEERALALLALADASSNDSPAPAFMKARLRLPSGVLLDVSKASTSALRDAARELLAKEAPRDKRGRGLTTTPAERDEAARLERDLHAFGLDKARVTPVAKNRAGAWLRIERFPLSALGRLHEALAHHLAPPKRKRSS